MDSANHALGIITAIAQQSQKDSTTLALLTGEERSTVLAKMAEALADRQDNILEANTLDLEASREMAVPELILEWLKLTPERLQITIDILQQLAASPDPLRQTLAMPYQISLAQTYRQRVPLGVVGLIYESFPELAAIAAGLCIRTGNSLILKGSSESTSSNQAIVETLQMAIENAGLPSGVLQLLPSELGESIRELVTQDQCINLIIPYGRPSLVQQVIRQATVPILKTAMGNCYLYWAASGSLDDALHMILDSRKSEPDPVNAIEKVLVHPSHCTSSLPRLWQLLQEQKFNISGDPDLVDQFSQFSVLQPVSASAWTQPYLDNRISFKVVDHVEAAIAWINQYSSGHADCLVTESYTESRKFVADITSAIVYVNASSRFYRNSGHGNPIALGMTSQKGYQRGLITPDTLMTEKYLVQGMT